MAGDEEAAEVAGRVTIRSRVLVSSRTIFKKKSNRGEYIRS